MVMLAVPLAGWSHIAFLAHAPDKAVRRCIPRRLLMQPPAHPLDVIHLVGRATDFALRKLPPRPARCTVQATARACLLRLSGVDAFFVSGVDKHPVHGLRFHAWVEYQGQALYEVDNVSTYLPLLSYPERA